MRSTILNSALLARVGPGLASAGCYGAVFYLVHRLSSALPATEIVFARGLANAILLLPWVVHGLPRMVTRLAIPLWLRSLAVEVAAICFTWNLEHTSVGLANALYNLSPLFVLLGGWALRVEKPSLRQMLNVLFVIFGSGIFWAGTSQHGAVPAAVWTVGFVSGTIAGGAGLALKRATVFWNPPAIAWSMSIAGISVSLLIRRGPWVALTPEIALSLCVICALGLAAQLLLAASFKRLEASTASALTLSSIVWGVLPEVLHGEFPPLHGVAGCSLYLFGMARLSLSPKVRTPAQLSHSDTKPAS